MIFICSTMRKGSSRQEKSGGTGPVPGLSQLHVTLTWPQSCGCHLCGHEPSQVLDLGFGACRLNWGVDGLKGGRHDLRQVNHADEDLWVPRKRSLSFLIDLIRCWLHAQATGEMAVTVTDLGLLSWSSYSWSSQRGHE